MKHRFLALLVLALISWMHAAEPTAIPLWPEGVPGLSADASPEKVVENRTTNIHDPFITMKDPFARKVSRSASLGSTLTPDSIGRLSTDQRVNKETPPTFLVHGNDDNWVPPENLLGFYEALRRAVVHAEWHLFEHGPHGMAMNPGIRPPQNGPKCWNPG